MNPGDTKRLYERESRQRRLAPEQDEFELWHRRLREFDVCDVEAALDSWNANRERNSKGEMKSKWLPVPAELEPLIVAAQRKREAAAREPKDFVAWECRRPDGCGYRCSGWVHPNGPRSKICGCGKSMLEVFREKASPNAA